ncbi:MAG: hypothetical protein SGBAC_010201 [Bacillariaceae sp.]
MLGRSTCTRHGMQRRKHVWLVYVAAIGILSTARFLLWTDLSTSWDSQLSSWFFPLVESSIPGKASSRFTIMVLGMDRFDSMKRLLDSLDATDYGADLVDLVIRFDRPRKATANWFQQVEGIRSRVWKPGNVTIVVSNESMGLRRSWLEAWNPKDEQDRAIILEDDVEVSPIWYKWLQQAHDAYDGRQDLAGISLQRQTLIPKKPPGVPQSKQNRRRNKNQKAKRQMLENPTEGQPFLFRLVGSIGFSPKASVWMDFLDFTNCALETDLDVSVPGLITSKWYGGYFDKTTMWTQLFIYFCNHQELSSLYYFPPGNHSAMAAHWREKGAHHSASFGRDFELATTNDTGNDFPSELVSLNWDGKPFQIQPPLRTLIMSVALHLGREEFDRFVLGLRQHYRGDIALLISNSAPSEIKDMLIENNVTVQESDVEGGLHFGQQWKRIIEARYNFYEGACRQEKYDLCMILDFQDVLFQSNPWAHMELPSEPTLHAYLQNIKTNRWAKRQVVNCKGADKSWLEDQWFINAGGLIATPSMLANLSGLNRMFGDRCDDQIALNLAIYGKKFSGVNNNTIVVHKQGEGSINNAVRGGVFQTDSRQRILNHNCFPSPVVHQFDDIEESNEKAKLG